MKTRRLELREARPEDAAWLHDHWGQPEVRKYLWDDEIVDKKKVDQLLEDGGHHWIIQLDGEPIGYVGLNHVPGHDKTEIIYSLDPSKRGHGYATEACQAVIKYAFVELGLSVLYGGADKANQASMRVLERLGMKSIGTLNINDQDYPYYAIEAVN